MPFESTGRAPAEGAPDAEPSTATTAQVVDANHTASVRSAEDQAPAAAALKEDREAKAGRTVLRATYGRWVLAGAAVQVVIADVGFFW